MADNECSNKRKQLVKNITISLDNSYIDEIMSHTPRDTPKSNQ